MLPERIKTNLLRGLGATPDLMERLLEGVPDSAVLDRRPDPERFTLREVVAHLADWEAVFLQRIRQTRDEQAPHFAGSDPWQIARERDYAHADPTVCLARFRQGRRELVEALTHLTPAQWERTGTHPEIGPISLETQAVMVASHDGYHLQQILEWLRD